jgi:hypothetical protein
LQAESNRNDRRLLTINGSLKGYLPLIERVLCGAEAGGAVASEGLPRARLISSGLKALHQISGKQMRERACGMMKKDSQEQFQLGQRLIRFTKETDGIVSLSLFQPRACRKMIESVREHEGWTSAKVSRRGADGEMRSVVDPQHRMASVLFSQHLSTVRAKFDLKMNDILKPLVEHLWGHRLSEHQGTQLVRYSSGGHYIPHSDVGRQTRNRYYTVLCYLNDDFEGGNTLFPTLNRSVKPRCGKAVLFRSAYLHGGEPVTSGQKYVLVSWITGPIPED